MVDQIFLAPGERADVLVDFSNAELGQEFYLYNLSFDPMHNEGGHGRQAGHGHGMPALGEGEKFPILKLKVARKSKYDRKIPERLCGPPDKIKSIGNTQRFTLSMKPKPPQWTINGLTYTRNETPIEVASRQVEMWQFNNTSQSMPHPQHTHGYFFRVLQRKGSPSQVKQLALNESGLLPTDLGWKDTVLTWPGEVVSVAVDFSNPNYPGEQIFLVHCHNLEHEDKGMMLNFKVS
jgi:FtsP/CotA-like multicopper oxidase with cupredoxin domain